MRRFDVLDEALPVDRNYFLEASAGTGKTFSIEHLVTRYLLELQPRVGIDRILVVTFTRAATRELIARIYRCIERTLEQATGAEERERLLDALLGFDEAQVFTIHGFCMQMLQQCTTEVVLGEQSLLGGEDLQGVVRDFFRSRLAHAYSPAQLQRVLGLVRGDYERLVALIAAQIERGIPAAGGQNVDLLRRAFGEQLPEESGARLLAEFENLARSFVGVADRQGCPKPEARRAMEAFCQMLDCGVSEEAFDQLILHGLPLLARPKNHAKISRPLPHHLGPILHEAREPRQILASMVADCQKMVAEHCAARERLTHGGVLDTMLGRLADDAFVGRIRARYATVIVDEFQDTDPTQWEIFRQLFVGAGVPVVLVGDPKQSIYAFRNSDVYCYLDAREALGRESCYSLTVNYRSRPNLVRALNGLFSRSNNPALFELPLREGAITYEEVSAGIADDTELSGEAAVEFLMDAEWEELYQFVAAEIVKLERPLSEFAVLVRDRYQGERVKRTLAAWGISAVTARGTPLAESLAAGEMRDLLEAVLSPKNERSSARARATRLSGGSETFVGLSLELGFANFYEKFLRSGAAERLLGEEGGYAYFQELEQVAAHLIDWERCHAASPEELVAYCNQLEQSPAELRSCEANAVQVLTAFASKGLEYGIVFALALSGGRGRQRAELVREGDQLVPEPSNPDLHADEEHAEQIRLLYVAMTRARERVYVPVVPSGGSSPVERFLGGLRCPLEAIAGVRVRRLKAESVVPAHLPLAGPHRLIEPTPLNFVRRERPVHSFTSLTRRGVEHPLARVEAEKLPAGPFVGVVIHNILEQISFRCSPDPQLVKPFLVGTPLEGFAEAVAAMLASSFQLELQEGWTLADVDPSCIQREMEFLYGEDELYTGVIDLIFEHAGEVFLLDWKTNQLPAYDAAALKGAMEQHNYFLQARLYREAAERYFKKSLGGVFYLFLRGPGVYRVD